MIGKVKPSAMRRSSSGGRRKVRRSYTDQSASTKWIANAPYSSTVPSGLDQTSTANSSAASAVLSETSPSAWLTRWAVM